MISNIYLTIETTLLLSVAALYIIHCPFNKVEESFNTQAIHDIVNLFPNSLPNQSNSTTYHDSDPGFKEIAIRSKLSWDHVEFPGVVPRTFIGALSIGLPLKIAKHFMSGNYISDQDQNDNQEGEHDLTMQFVLQIGSRFALSSLVVLSLSAITKALHKRYGLGFRLCFLITTVGQFHYMFYAGRFLPNTFACILANLVFASWIKRQYSKSIIYIAACVIIFRFDTAIFFGWLLFDGVFIRKFLPLGRVLKIGIPAGLLAIMATFCIDSIFWARPVWPELEGLYFNIWLNKSHEWGTSPYFWYIYDCIPRMMLLSSPFIVLGEHKITRDYLIPALAFILTYSILPHKELRFILFINPLLNICATSGLINVHYYLTKIYLSIFTRNKQASTTSGNRKSFLVTFFFALMVLAILTANIFACFILSRISSHNYPGGQAALSLATTKELLDKASTSFSTKQSGNGKLAIQDPRSDVAVYVNNLAAQTGFSRFVQVDGVYYAKTQKFNQNTLKKSYKLLYLVLEPKEIVHFIKDHCPVEENPDKLFSRADKWKQSNSEIKCRLLNQPKDLMYCSIVDSVNSFSAINIGGLLRRLKQINSLEAASNSLDEKGFIRTRVALHIIRCSKTSRSNPF